MGIERFNRDQRSRHQLWRSRCDLISLIGHVQASIKLIGTAMAPKAQPGSQDNCRRCRRS
jgi:hypothetical protein